MRNVVGGFGTVLLLASIACVASGRNGSPQVVREESIEVLHESIEEVWSDATAVVHGRVISSGAQKYRVPGSDVPSVVTRATLRVETVYKGEIPLGPGRMLEIHDIAGTVPHGETTITVEGREPLKVGRVYVTFLGWNKYFDRWMVRGSDGVFELRDATIRAVGRSKVATKHNGKPASVLLDELRRLAEGTQP